MFKYNRKQFFLIATTLFLVVFLFSGCSSSKEKDYNDGYNDGYADGHADGIADADVL